MSWLRRNRVGLCLLPVALLAAAAGNGQRLQTWWWEGDLRVAHVAATGAVLQVDDEFDDGHIHYPITPRIRLVDVEPTTSTEVRGELTTPRLAAGAALWRVRLEVQAPPDMPLRGCSLALVDAAGTRWEAKALAYEADSFIANDPCTPPERSGPLGPAEPGDPPPDPETVRPQAYTVTSYVATPTGARPTEVWVWWFKPRYAVLPIAR